jgi:hypothetical protein
MITFDIYESDDCTGTAVFSQQSTVDGDSSYEASETVTAAGSFWWQVTYGGDANNEPASTPCTDGAITVTKADVELSETRSPVSGVVGDTFSDQVTLEGGYVPVGDLTFSLHHNDSSCSVVLTSVTVPVDGDATYEASFTPSSPGVYYWLPVYSGDGNNNGDASPCSSGQISVHLASPAFGTQTPANAGIDTWVDVVALSGGYSPTGTITFDMYAGDSCTGTPVETLSQSASGNGAYASQPFNPLDAEDYTFGVSYGGDGNNNPTSTWAGGTFYNPPP